jgi:sec-independent protein translocase protein TatC
MARLKPVSHDDRLTVVEHLDELRSRIIVSLLAFGVIFAVCFWQNHAILSVLNDPLPNGKEPVTLGVAEGFMTTFTVCAYTALVLALPILLYQVYAFVLPAFTPKERQVAGPMLLMVPFLFIAGVVFSYFVVVPNAVHFLLNFNADEFNTQIRAREYYSFVTMSLAALGIMFQIPVGVLILTRAGIVSADTLAKNRRYAILVIAVLAMLLPGVDPITMIIEMLPLVVLFEVSILLARAFGRPSGETAGEVVSAEGS